MIKHVIPAIMLTLLMTALTGLAYPLAMTGLAGRLFPHQANGSLIERDGVVVGSELIGQNFIRADYFHGRPSATTDTDPNDSTKSVPAPYNAGNSAGSNLGPTSKALVDRVKEAAAALAAENPSAAVPIDLVTTSASGLDPDITPAGALFQVPRVAKVRGISEDRLRRLVEANTAGRLLGILGEPHVNVLKLNLALDETFPAHASRENKETPPAEEATPGPLAAAIPRPSAAAPVVEESPEPPASDAAASAPSAVETPAAVAVAAPHVDPLEKSAPKSGAVFPSEISPAHAGKKPGMARLGTCSDQFHANEATKSNGGLKWADYWSLCKKRLKS